VPLSLRCAERGKGFAAASAAPINSLIHSPPSPALNQQRPARQQPTKPAQPLCSARFRRQSPPPFPSPTTGGREKIRSERPGGPRRCSPVWLCGACSLVMDEQRRPRFFKVIVGDFTRRMVSSLSSSCCCLGAFPSASLSAFLGIVLLPGRVPLCLLVCVPGYCAVAWARSPLPPCLRSWGYLTICHF
jgi:hypothetical protein